MDGANVLTINSVGVRKRRVPLDLTRSDNVLQILLMVEREGEVSGSQLKKIIRGLISGDGLDLNESSLRKFLERFFLGRKYLAKAGHQYYQLGEFGRELLQTVRTILGVSEGARPDFLRPARSPALMVVPPHIVVAEEAEPANEDRLSPKELIAAYHRVRDEYHRVQSVFEELNRARLMFTEQRINSFLTEEADRLCLRLIELKALAREIVTTLLL